MEIPEIDKQVTAEVMQEFSGQTIPSICEVCKGACLVPDFDGERWVGVECDNCQGTGTVSRSY